MQMFVPTNDRILVKVDKGAECVVNGIVRPQADSDAAYGSVSAVGPGRITDSGRLVEPRVREGDRVAFGRFAGSAVTVDGVPFVVLREDDLLGIIK